MILTLRTDKPEAEIGLYDHAKRLRYITWQAHRELAETLHQKIAGLLDLQGATLTDVSGIVIYKGPGSYTGLRIGIAVANALAYSSNAPVVAATGRGWIETGISNLINAQSQSVLPLYEAPAKTTSPKK